MATTFYVGQTDYIPQLNILADMIHDVSDTGSYTERVDSVDNNLYYVGHAAVGSSEGSPVWRIKRVTITSNDDSVSILWADSNANFDNVWTNRASLAYG